MDTYNLDAPLSVTDEEISAGRLKKRQNNIPRSEQEMLWLVEYLRNGNNPIKAAVAAGYPDSIAERAHNWVKLKRENSQKPDFWDIVKQAKRRRLSHLDATRERVMLEYSRIAFFDPEQMYDPDTGLLLHIKDMPEDTRRAIAGFDVTTNQQAERVAKIKLNQKNNALKDLSLILGITKETVVHEHKFADLLKEIQHKSPSDPLVDQTLEIEAGEHI